MIHNPKKFYAALFSLALLALLAITVAFHAIDAPIERNIAEMQADMTAARLAADAAHEALMDEQRAQLEARYEGFTLLDIPLDEWTQRETFAWCKEAGVPFEVLMSLIEVESEFNPKAISKTNDHGLAQINACNLAWLREYGITDIYDPLQNVHACLLILGPLWEKYEPHKALMAYQYGEAGARRKWAAGQETSRHSRKVLAEAEVYGWSF